MPRSWATGGSYRSWSGQGILIGSALLGAVGGGHRDIAIELLDHGASAEAKDEYGRTPLYRAASHGKPDMLQLLVLKGGDIDAWDDNFWTPLYTAAHSAGMGGDPAVLFALLAAGADVHLRSDKLFKRLPLHLAAFAGCADVLRALIEHGNDVNAVDVFQDTVLPLRRVREWPRSDRLSC